MSCVFCGIAAGAEPASVVHDDGEVLAFLTTAPVNPGHVLVAPRAHATGLADLPPDTGVAMWRLAQALAVALGRDPRGPRA